MKFFDCVDVHPFTSAADFFGERRYQFRATVTIFSVAVGDIDDFPDAVARRAAESALKGAGLRAAVQFDADILPFVDLGLTIKRGDEVGIVTRISKVEGEESIGVQWEAGPEDFDPDLLGDALRIGALVLA